MRGGGNPATRVAAALTAGALLLIEGCSGGGARTPVTESASPGLQPDAAPQVLGGAVVVRSEPWSFDGHQGSVLRSAHFSIYTTKADPVITDRLPRFMEAALLRYSSAITPLPLPAAPMESFIMASRPQWQALTLRMMGPRGRVLTYIERGGFTTSGRSYLFDIGDNDTLAIASHEGWHQFTQSTFAEAMPVWIEEGLATYMEGHRWSGQGVMFLPWSNLERFDQLHVSAGRHKLLSLEEVLAATPESLIQNPGNSNDAAVSYYSQVWALVHFLREGEGGRYRAGLEALVSDAAAGRLGAMVRMKAGPRAGMLAQRLGPVVFGTYFNNDLGEASRQYAWFIEELAKGTSRGAVVAGFSPVAGFAAAPGGGGQEPDSAGGRTKSGVPKK